ncbi:MAG: cytochrome P450 [Nevskia sp.]|nr:cytochrome P450 [Nevskia sp.]
MAYFDPFDHAVHDNPYPVYQDLRDHDPLYHNDRHGFWIVSRYDDCVKVLRDFATFCNKHGQTLEPTGKTVPPILLLMDPPHHTRLRKVVARVLTPERIGHLEGDIRRLAQELLAPFHGQHRIDIVADFSAYLPMAIIARMLKIPREHEDMMRAWTDACVHRDDGVFAMPEAGLKATMDMWVYFEDLVKERRKHPYGDDLVSLILQSEDAKEMSHEEVIGFLYILAIAGNETTTKLIGNMSCQLSRHPEQLRLLREQQELLPSAVEETMRFDGPTQLQARTATRDVEMYGKTIREGDKVGILFISANRDERHYQNADVYDVRRNPRDHIGFGAGVHACLGAALARLEVRIAFEEIFKLAPEFSVEESGLKRMHSPNVRGYTSVPMSF